MNNTENRFKYEVVWFVAVEQEGCRGCAFGESQEKCIAPDPEYSDVPPCGASRKDNRSVIFIESDADNKGGEE